MNRYRTMLLITTLILALLAGCGRNNFPKYPALGDLRILTIVADRPEANPGDTVTFTPVLSDLLGNGRAINYSVQACIDPGVGIGAAPACPTPDPASLQTGTVTIAPGASQTYTGAVAGFSLTMPDASVMFAGRSAVDQFNGVAYLVFYSISVPNGPSVNSFLRVIVSASTKTQKNQNPVMTSLDLNDTPVGSLIPMPASSVNFRVTAPLSSSETYTVMKNDGSVVTQNEELINTWFYTDGEFDFERTIADSENAWNPPAAKPSGRGSIIFVVTRDGRGGAAFQKIEMN
jgi:hypothetical protein